MLTLQALCNAKLSCSLKVHNAQKTHLALTVESREEMKPSTHLESLER